VIRRVPGEVDDRVEATAAQGRDLAVATPRSFGSDGKR
jgi:hypothetical protein